MTTRKLDGAVGVVVDVVGFCSTLICTPATLTSEERDAPPVFAGNVNVALPEPVPDPPDTVTQAADDEIVQAHVDDEAVTVIVPLPPAGAAATSSGVTAKVHDGLGSVTTKLVPATVSVALRAAAVVFADAVNAMLPDPVRPVPFETVTHAAPLEALHAHPAEAVTVTVPVPPDAASDWLPGVIAYEHGADGCVTVNVWPAIVTVPLREPAVVFAAAL